MSMQEKGGMEQYEKKDSKIFEYPAQSHSDP